jgi:hypothetical protein
MENGATPETTQGQPQQSQGYEGVDPSVLSAIGHQTQHLTQQTSKHDEVISKLEKVFSKAEEKPDGWYDDVLQAALEAEKNGQPIPLTVKISTELRRAQENNQKLMQELEAIKQKQAVKDNPGFQADQMAYNHMDMFMAQELKSHFGDAIPKATAAAVTQDLSQKIAEEQRNNPQRWQQIRSNPEMMARIVRNAVATTIPPRARQIAAEHAQANAVYDPEEIKENLDEAMQLLRTPEVRGNPQYYSKVSESIEKMRAMYWESLIPGQGRRARV